LERDRDGTGEERRTFVDSNTNSNNNTNTEGGIEQHSNTEGIEQIEQRSPSTKQFIC